MEVQLYVYDLTKGMARVMSQQLTGIHIDAVYHTSLVFDNIEYFFGAGVQTCYAGQTHHGKPMEIISMGTTHLPMETILEYLESLKQVYTPESYDLFAHNCNNFTNDFGMFLVGKGIPDHITALPKRVLDTPFGQMLKPQIDASMRSITQAEVPASRLPPPKSAFSAATAPGLTNRPSATESSRPYGEVKNLSSLSALDSHLSTASKACTTVFFTSSTCAPCRLAYPMFDNLAGEHPEALFIKVDINEAHDVAARYKIRATPTFMTFSKGQKEDEWSGADPILLKTNVERLINLTFPPHPHSQIRVPTIQSGSLRPVTYSRIPPLEKLIAKLGAAASSPHIQALHDFVNKRNADPREAPLPDLQAISAQYAAEVALLPQDRRFAAVDLLRCAMIDPRVSGYFAEESHTSTILELVKQVNELADCPHNLRLVTIHLACNIFTSSLYAKSIMQDGSELLPQVVTLISSSLIDVSHPTTRVAAASLAFNLATANYCIRREEGHDALTGGEQVELAASLIEVVPEEENEDALKVMLITMGYLAYFAPRDGELADLFQVMDLKSALERCKMQQSLAKEVASLI